MIGLAWWAWVALGVAVWAILVVLIVAFFVGACADLPPSAGTVDEEHEPW